MVIVPVQAQDIRCFKPTDADATKAWFFAAVHFSQVNDLAKGLHLARFDEKSNTWHASVPGKGTLKLTATSQSMQEGDALFSARIWQADQDYAALVIESTLQATVTEMAQIRYIDHATQTTHPALVVHAVTPNRLAKGHGQYDLAINAILYNVKRNDRICFLLGNSGDGQGSHLLQTWHLQIIGLSPIATNLK